MYGTGGELPGGDAIVPNGMKSLVDSMLANTQVNFRTLRNVLLCKILLSMHSFFAFVDFRLISGFVLGVLLKKAGS